jgi:predicted DNA-binding transcriptional regulator YafY
MILSKYLSRLQRLDQLIRQNQTGTPKELARKMGISERQAYNCIDDMKELGLPISYDRYRQSYFYEEPVQLSVNISFRNLSSGEIIKIEGGRCSAFINNSLLLNRFYD